MTQKEVREILNAALKDVKSREPGLDDGEWSSGAEALAIQFFADYKRAARKTKNNVR